MLYVGLNKGKLTWQSFLFHRLRVLSRRTSLLPALVQVPLIPDSRVYDTYVIGGVQTKGYVNATAYGLQATPGTGVIAVGEYVYAAAPAAVQVAETLSTTLRVVSATTQATAAGLPFKARVVSLGPVGTGAVGTAIVIELL